MNYLNNLESVAIAPITLRGDIARTSCPIHMGDNNSTFVFWTDTGRYFCHSCAASGNIVDLVMKTKDMSESDAINFLKLDHKPTNNYESYKRDKSAIDFTQENNYFLSWGNERAKELFDKLIHPDAMTDMDTSLLYGLIGYDNVNDTLTVAIKDGDRVVQIKRRQVGDVKWKGMADSDGSYTPSRLTGKKTVYVASGMAEYIILQASGLDYIALQSDTSKIPFDLSDKVVVIFEDNDTKESPLDTPPELRDPLDLSLANHFKLKVTTQIKSNTIISIDFQNVLDKTLPYGFDLRDFVNAYPKEWVNMIEIEIKYWFKEGLC